MPAPTFTLHRCQGFTLVETIIVLVVVAIAAAGITVMTGNIFSSQKDNTTLQLGMKVAQECAEHIIMRRRATADFSTFTPTCPATTMSGFAAASVSYLRQNQPGGPTCPTGTTTCMLVTITPRTAAAGGGVADELAPISLLLVGP